MTLDLLYYLQVILTISFLFFFFFHLDGSPADVPPQKKRLGNCLALDVWGRLSRSVLNCVVVACSVLSLCLEARGLTEKIRKRALFRIIWKGPRQHQLVFFKSVILPLTAWLGKELSGTDVEVIEDHEEVLHCPVHRDRHNWNKTIKGRPMQFFIQDVSVIHKCIL